MKIFNAEIYDKEADRNILSNLAVIETEKERKHYENAEYDELFRSSGYDDNDIFYYVDRSEIPQCNNGYIMEGDLYDYIVVLSSNLIYQTH